MALPPLPVALQQQLSLPLDSKDLAVPQFVALYQYLSTTVLDSTDLSDRAQNKFHEKEGIQDKVRKLWTRRAKRAILIRSLREVCVQTPSKDSRRPLSTQIRESGLITATYLSEQHAGLSDDHAVTKMYSRAQIESLMASELEEFYENLNDIAGNVGQHILDCETTLKDLLLALPTATSTSIAAGAIDRSSRIPSRSQSNATSTSRKHQPAGITTTPTTTTTTTAALLEQQINQHTQTLTQTLPTQLSTLSTQLQSLLNTQTTLLTTQINHLETFTHSTQSRNLITHAQFLSTVSKGIALKAQIHALLHEKDTYAQSGMHEALTREYKSLLRQDTALARREHDLTTLLAEYDSFEGGEDTFKTLGVEYARVETEIGNVRMDIERLRGQL